MKLIKTIKSVAAVTFKEWAAYRSHMILSLIIGPIFFLVQYSIWKAVYSGQQTTIAGFTLVVWGMRELIWKSCAI